MAWLSGWGARKSHLIVHAASAGTLYPVKIIVYKTTGSDSGSAVYVGTAVRDDFKDVRFTADDGTTLLDCFMESFTSGVSATFWVEVAGDLTTVDKTIYVYYAKAAETTIVSNAIAANILQLREHKYYAGYNPNISFSIQGGTRVQCVSDSTGLGYGWMFLVVPRLWLHGKYLRFSWLGTHTGTIGGSPWVVQVYDGIYLRSSAVDFPADAYLPTKGVGKLQDVDSQSDAFGATTVDVLMDLDGGNQDFCTIFFAISDAWAGTTGLSDDLDWVEVNTAAAGSGNLLSLHFADVAVNMEVTGGVTDSGLARKYVSPEPAHSTWGAVEYGYAIVGVVRDGATGAAIASATVWLFKTSDKSYQGVATSDGSGNYTISVPDNSTAYFIRAYKDGSPNLFGATDDDLVGVAL